MTGGGDNTVTCVHDTAYDKASASCDTARHGHDTAPVCTMTRRPARGVRSAWAQCVRRLGLGCAPCAPNPVLTQDTILSHCLDHCS